MPTLNFKGKSFVHNHHLAVKYHQLVPKKDKSLTDKVSLHDNLIVQGDNLKALKALLPTYAGKVKCIYIDPPYNTGNEGWAYNDKVNSPMIREWLGNVVDKDDLTRHDKWLCMMTPRLKLLRELLAEDGVIFISIDDNEATHLKLLLDEIFEQRNFISTIIVQLNPRGRTLDRFLAKTHEYIHVYGKNAENDKTLNLIEKEGKLLATYNKEDENGKYRLLELRNRNPVFNRENRPNLYYPIYVNPKTFEVSLEKTEEFSQEVFPINSQNVDGCWTWGKDKLRKNTKIVVGKKASTGAWRIHRKDYLHDTNGNASLTKAKALWIESNINNENGKEAVNDLFEGNGPFDFPKSIDLIKKCLIIGTNKDDIILDSFAGSGTTAHAVLDLNKEDGGNRKFILVEMEDYADKITAERVRRVIKGVPTSKNFKEGTGGTFSYFELGEPIEMESILRGENLPSYEEFAKYLFYTATGEEFDPSKINEETNYIGTSKDYEIYLFYKPDIDYLKSTALTLDRAKSLGKHKGKKRLVFAPAKFVDNHTLTDLRIEFSQLPFEIYKLKS